MGGFISLDNLYFDETFAKDDHKAWAEFLRERMRPGDYLLLVAPQAEKIVEYYMPPGLPWESLPTLGRTRDWQEFLDREAVLKAYRNHPRVWLLELHAPVADPNLHITDLLNRWGAPTDNIIFRGISTEIRLQSFVYDKLRREPTSPLSEADRISFTRNLELIGYETPPQIEAGGRAAANLFWQLRRKAPGDVNVSLRVVDQDGKVWGQWDAPPVGSLKPLTTWEPGKTVLDQHDLVVDAGAPPGKYFVELGVYSVPDGKNLPAFKGGEKTQAPIRLADIEVTRPAAPRDPHSLVMDESVDVAFGDVVRFLGYDLEERGTNPGSDISLTLYFQMLKAHGANLNGRLELVPPGWQLWNSTHSSAPFTLDMENRQAGDIVQAHVAARVPGEASTGNYDLRLALDGLRPQTFIPSDAAALGSVHVDALARSTDLPPITHPVNARFADKIEFLGYALEAAQPLKREAPVRLTLYWRALKPMDTSYTVFAHLINGDNKIFGQKDKQPLDGKRPTTSWAPGEIFTDTYEFQVAADAPPGAYRLEIGLYNGADFVRLPAFDVNGAPLGDRVLFEDLRVQ